MVVFTVERRSFYNGDPSLMESLSVGTFSSRAKVVAYLKNAGKSWREGDGEFWFWVDQEIVDSPMGEPGHDLSLFEMDAFGHAGGVYDLDGEPNAYQPPRYGETKE